MTLDEIAARADAATEGPWEAWAGVSGKGKKIVGPRKSGDLAQGPVVLMQPLFWDSRSTRNAEFIAHAREDVPRLVAALRAVEAACQDSEMASVRSFARTFDGALFDAMLSTREIRAAIRGALGA